MKTLSINLLLLLCVAPLTGTAEGTRERWQAELLQADKDFANLSMQSNPKQAFAAYMAPNILMIPRAGDPVEGYENALASFGEGPGFALLWQPQLAEVANSGEMGWTWGTYQVLVDGLQVSNGKYVNIWTRQQDGTWKVRMDMGNQEPAQQSSSQEPQPEKSSNPD